MKTKILVLIFIVTIQVFVNAQKTILIGSQTWMVENLKTNSFKNGDIIRQIFSDNEWENCTYNKIPAFKINPNTNEYHYNYFAVNDPRGLAPNSFRIPTMEDFIQLGINCGGKRNFMIRNDGMQFDWIEGVSSVLRNQYWENPGKNSFGFNANRTGMVQYNGKIDANHTCSFWTTNGHISLTDKKNTEYSYDEFLSGMKGLFPSNKESYKLFVRSMNSDNLFIRSGSYYDQGYSIRCIKI
jgi:uncharacterized protein (TIGR02145 family)